jgi:hypothetical protein
MEVALVHKLWMDKAWLFSTAHRRQWGGPVLRPSPGTPSNVDVTANRNRSSACSVEADKRS